MKFIAINDFPNPPGKPIVIQDIKDDTGKVVVKQAHVTDAVTGAPRTDFVHKGAQFVLGTAGQFDDLAPAEKQLVAQLRISKKIVEATPANVEKVAKELAADAKRAQVDATRSASADPLKVLGDALANLPQGLAEALAAGLAAQKPALAAK